MAEAAETAQPPVSPQVVGNAFVQQYYHILHHSPGLVHRFYQDISKLGRSEVDGSMSITTTMQAINEKVMSLNYGDFKAEIKSLDAQESLNGGFQVLVTGNLMGKDNIVRNFAQSFFLAPQDVGYFVLNDMFRYVDDAYVNPALDNDVVAPISAEPTPALIQENHISEQSTPSSEEAIAGEVYNPPENGHVPVVEEEMPVAEVVDELQDASPKVVEASNTFEKVPKKSYASIVMDLKQKAANISRESSAPQKAPPMKMEQVSPTLAPAPEGPVSISESANDNGNIQASEAYGYSIYIKGLPMHATDPMLEEVFKKFGTIKSDGIQVRSNRQQGFCFGFVEFEEESSVLKAIEASPVAIGGRRAFIEEKKSTISRGNNSVRFQSGRASSGFRNEGGRGGRGNYIGGRSYIRDGGFNGGRREFVNRGGGNRGRSSDREGYHKSENIYENGGRIINSNGGMANGNSKNTTPRVSATA